MNNPLYILHNHFFKYAGEVDSDTEYKSFDSLSNGYRAGFYILKYYKRIGYSSIENIINNMLPDNKYNEIYIKYISDNLNINKDDIIRDNKEHINIIFHLSFLLNNEYEKDTYAILEAFFKVYSYVPYKEINFEVFAKYIDDYMKAKDIYDVNIEQQSIDYSTNLKIKSDDVIDDVNTTSSNIKVKVVDKSKSKKSSVDKQIVKNKSIKNKSLRSTKVK
jgi:hypothetical protein